MEDKPEIPFVQKLCIELTKDEIREAESRMYELCLWLKEAHEFAKLTNENKRVE